MATVSVHMTLEYFIGRDVGRLFIMSMTGNSAADHWKTVLDRNGRSIGLFPRHLDADFNYNSSPVAGRLDNRNARRHLALIYKLAWLVGTAAIARSSWLK